jgi:cupin 2 domain-containing protein
VANVRIERIVSTSQTTPPGEWFDQDWDEWVLLISGAAEILLAEKTPRDCSNPATTSSFRRISGTGSRGPRPERPTIWLAIHIDSPAPKVG